MMRPAQEPRADIEVSKGSGEGASGGDTGMQAYRASTFARGRCSPHCRQLLPQTPWRSADGSTVMRGICSGGAGQQSRQFAGRLGGRGRRRAAPLP